MTIISLIVIAILFIITWIVIATTNTQSLPKCCLDCLHNHDHFHGYPFECCDHFGMRSLKQENSSLRLRNQMLENQILSVKPLFQTEKVYASTVEQQEVIDRISKLIPGAEKLVADLKQSIKN